MRNLARYIFARLIAMVPTLFGITLVTFLLLNLVPGGPAQRLLQQVRAGAHGAGGVPVDLSAQIEKDFGFDRPLGERYGAWLARTMRLDFGESSLYAKPVSEVIGPRFRVTAAFGIVALLSTYVLSIAIGVWLSRARESWLELLVLSLTAVPSFALGIGALWLFASGNFLEWFPLGYLTSRDYGTLSAGGRAWDLIHHAALPLAVYVAGGLAGLAFLSRNTLREETGRDYVRTARSKGLPENVIWWRHVLRNALIPILAGFGANVAGFFGGSILIETLFQIDGIGSLAFRALGARDYNLIMGLLVVQTGLLFLGNLLGDLLYAWIDPRVTYEAAPCA